MTDNVAYQPDLFPPATVTEGDGRPSDQCFTPRWVFDALGCRFDVDVAAPFGGVPWIPADRYYHIGDDGLAQPWDGFVWMNPPYSSAAPWVRRFLAHGHGIGMLPTSDTRWFSELWEHPGITMVYPSTSVCFIGPDGTKKSIFLATVLVGAGDRAREVLAGSGLGRAR